MAAYYASPASGLFALLLALEEGKDWGWTSYPILILFTAAVLLLALFVVIEFEVDSPMLDLRVFARFQFTLPLVLISAISLAIFASSFFIPQFLQGPVRGLTPVNTGLALIPQALVLAAADRRALRPRRVPLAGGAGAAGLRGRADDAVADQRRHHDR